MKARRGRPKAGAIGTDWESIQALWQGGMSIGELCRRYVITPRAIGYRSETKGWDHAKRQESLRTRPRWASKPKGMEHNGLPIDDPQSGVPEITPLPDKPHEQELSDQTAWAQTLLRVTHPLWGDGFPVGEAARCLDAMCRAMPFGMACELVGVPERTMLGYRQREPRLDGLFRRARALAADVAIQKIMGDRDWRAAAWLLERGIARAEFKQEDAGGGQEKLVIEIQVSRDEKIAARNGVVMIDVTPDAGVEDLARLGPRTGAAPALPEPEDLLGKA